MARQVLENGVILPAEYSDDWYDDMTSNLTKLDDVIGSDSEKLSSADVGAAALSNNYNDLDNLPTIPTVNDATLTIQKNGVDVQTFTANASSNVTANITVPTKTSDLTNDSNFVDTSNSAVSSGITSAKVTDYDTHIADTDIHVTTSDKTSWNTVTSKANDSDVVHRSGDETVGGIKTFSNNTYITSLNFTNEVESQSSSSSALFPIVTTVTYADQSPSQTARLNFSITANGDKSLYPHENNQYALGLASRRWTTLYGYFASLGGVYLGDESSGNERTNLYLLANRDSDGQSGAYIGRFRQNRAQGAMSGGDVSFVSLSFLENSIRYTRCFDFGLTDWDSNGVPKTYYFSSPNNKGSLGSSQQKWQKINGLEPSSLGMPDLSNGIDISSYITVVANGNKESLYTPPANGWISVRLSRTSGSLGVLLIQGGMATSGKNIEVESGATTADAMLPVVGGVQVSINSALADGVVSAYFYPCLGNV